jgi:hypothetical protein
MTPDHVMRFPMRVQSFVGPILALTVVSCGDPSPPPARSPNPAKVAARKKPPKTPKPAGSSSSVAFDSDGFPVTAPSATAVAWPKASPDDFKPAEPAEPAAPRRRDFVVLDPSQPRDAPIGSKVAKSEETRILDLVFGKGKYLSGYDQCPKTVGGDVASRRARGFFAPSVGQSIPGAFTKAGASETLAYVCNGECNAQGSVSFQVVVLEGDAVKASVNVPTYWTGIGWSTIGAVFDLDGDGRSEFIRTVTDNNQGERTAAEVMRVDGSKLATIQSFQILNNACPWGDSIEYSIVRVVQEAGATPVLKLDKKTKPCP